MFLDGLCFILCRVVDVLMDSFSVVIVCLVLFLGHSLSCRGGTNEGTGELMRARQYASPSTSTLPGIGLSIVDA
jgi:hypothetical protein